MTGKSVSVETLIIDNVEFGDTFKRILLDNLAESKNDDEYQQILKHVEQVILDHDYFSQIYLEKESEEEKLNLLKC